MSYEFRPARMENTGLWIALAGGTNSGKTFSALRLARGIAGPDGKIAALDTEAGRMSHYANDFKFDVMDMAPPFRPERFAQAAQAAEDAGYAVLVIDSFSMEWVGPGGVLEWQEQELARLGGKDSVKMLSWVKPKLAHKAMVWSFLQRRMPIIFAMRAEEKPVPGNEKVKLWQPICNKAFPFELTVALMLAGTEKGRINLNMPSTKMEGAHQTIFQDGDLISEEHGAKLAAWSRGEGASSMPAPFMAFRSDGKAVRFASIEAWAAWWDGPVKKATAAQLRALREANAELMGEYAEENNEAVMGVQEAIRARLEAEPAASFAPAGQVAA